MDAAMEVVGICRTTTAAIKSRKTVLAFFLGIYIAGLEISYNVISFYALIYISKQKLLVANKLMARIEVSPGCHSQVLRT